MKDIILKRGQGKTLRLVAISEFNQIPIICTDDEHRKNIVQLASRKNYEIPYPITAREIVSGRFQHESHKQYLVDDSQDVLCALISAISRGTCRVVGMTTTDNRD